MVQKPVTDSRFRVQDKTADERSFIGTRGGVTLQIAPDEAYPHTHLRMTSAQRELVEKLYTSHLGFAKVFMEHDFGSVLDIGSGNGSFARAFRFLGKDVTTVDVTPASAGDEDVDYLNTQLGRQFDLVWCSHILEHQRNVGAFLDRVFDDLKEGGIAAVTVPSALSPMLIGHPNVFTPMHVVYSLILAGFDCRDARLKCYDWQFTVIVNKRPNGIRRSNTKSPRRRLTRGIPKTGQM